MPSVYSRGWRYDGVFRRVWYGVGQRQGNESDALEEEIA